jgi:hypothetical protein
MVVGLGSLFVFTYQARLMRESAHASVLPYLTVIVMSNEQGSSLVLNNSGIGPALIDDVHVRYQGRDRQIDPYDFFLEVRPDAEKAGIGMDKIQPGRLIPAGYGVHMIEAGAGDPKRAGEMMKDILHFFEVADVPRSWYANAGESKTEKAVIEITYSSVYGEHWRIRSDRMVPERQ